MDDGKVFDVKRVKVKIIEPAKQKQPEKKPSIVKLHTKFFDWHTVSYVLYALAVILALIAAILVTRYLTVRQQEKISNNKAADQKLIQTATTDTSTDTKPATANPFAPPETTQPNTQTTIDKKTIKIRVLNGNGITGDAVKAKTELENADFTVSQVGNAKQQNYTKTEVYYLKDKQEQAKLVGEALTAAGRSVELSEASIDIIGADTEVLVITGAK